MGSCTVGSGSRDATGDSVVHVAGEIDGEVDRCWEVAAWVEQCSVGKSGGPVESVVSVGSTVAVVVVDRDVARESEEVAVSSRGDVDIAHVDGCVDGGSALVVDVGQSECSGDGQGQVVDGDARFIDVECPGVECSSGDGSDVSVVSAEGKFGTA